MKKRGAVVFMLLPIFKTIIVTLKISIMKYFIIIIVASIAIACGHKEDAFATSSKDYNVFLHAAPKPSTSKYYELWNHKITKDSSQLLSFGNVAAEYNRYFKNTGDISFLKKAEQALTKAVEIANINQASYKRALARNYIAQHRFKEALTLAEEAQKLGGGAKETKQLLFDVHMELGNYSAANSYLDSITNLSDFGYLIRVAKWNDYKGDLDTTIRFMEKAMVKAESAKNRALMLWSYTNIADYYGHAGRIAASYEYYLKSLSLDPQNAYAKKGIAWIIFSHEKNGKEALRILDAITENYHAPDYYMLKAEIADFMGDKQKRNQNLDTYASVVANKHYGDMYNGYNVEYYLGHTNAIEKAFHLAKIEVGNRPTPESYNLLATAFYKNKEYGKALQIVEEHIMDKTYEPAILWNAAKIYKANQKLKMVTELKPELLGAVYELGPAALEQIQSL